MQYIFGLRISGKISCCRDDTRHPSHLAVLDVPRSMQQDKNSCGHFAQTHRVELFLAFTLVSSCTESATGPDISGFQSCKNKDDSGASLQIPGAEWHPFQADPSIPSSVNLGSSKFSYLL